MNFRKILGTVFLIAGLVVLSLGFSNNQVSACYIGGLDVVPGTCSNGSLGNTSITGSFYGGAGYRGTVEIDGVQRYQLAFSGAEANHSFDLSRYLAPGNHTVKAYLEQKNNGNNWSGYGSPITVTKTVVACPTPTTVPGVHNVPICHATASNNNPYVSISPDYDSIFNNNGHGSHTGGLYPTDGWGDIIPSFWWHTGDKNMVLSDNASNPPGSTGWTFYAGLNWPAGKTILDNGCNVPTPPSSTPTMTSTTAVPPTATPVTPTATPETPTEVPPTATPETPTATPFTPTVEVPTATPETPTEIPPTETTVVPPPTATPVTPTVVPPTEIPPTNVPTKVVHYGCTDPLALNFAPGADRDGAETVNGSCIYATATPKAPETGAGDGIPWNDVPWTTPAAAVLLGLGFIFLFKK